MILLILQSRDKYLGAAIKLGVWKTTFKQCYTYMMMYLHCYIDIKQLVLPEAKNISEYFFV